MANKMVKYFKGRVKSIDPKTFTAEVVISDETVDRHKERILASAYKKTLKTFMQHPILLSSHTYRGLMSQIGEFTKIKIVDNEVVAWPKWYVGEGNPEADWGWKLAEKGIAAFSVGFIPKSWVTHDDEDDRKKNNGSFCDYTDLELLETSQVLIPANPSALQRSFESDDEDPIVRDVASSIIDLAKDETFFKEMEDIDQKISDKLGEEDEIENKKWEETENEIRHRVKEPDLFEKFRYGQLKKDKPRVNCVYGKYKGKDEWTIQALRFPKGDGWTMESAKAWAKEHPVKEVYASSYFDDIGDFVDFNTNQEAIDFVGTSQDSGGEEGETVKQIMEMLKSMNELLGEMQKGTASINEVVTALVGVVLQKKEIDGDEVINPPNAEETLSPEKMKEMETFLRNSLGVSPSEQIDEETARELIAGFVKDTNEYAKKVFSVPPSGKEQ